MSRFFWGAPIPTGEKRTKLHVPLAGDIASMSADLLFAEPPEFILEEEKAQERLDEICDEMMIDAVLLEAAEIGSALGGVYICVAWDDEFADFPFLRAVHADAAVPEFRWGELEAVTFWQVLHEENGKVWRHLERHETGLILHGLYIGTVDELGQPHPLGAHPATEKLSPVVIGVEEMLTAQYVPNMRPNRLDRTSNLGRSDYSPGALTLMDALDETYSSWMRDLRLGKGRIVAPDVFLQNNGPGQGSTWDADREVYSGLNMLPTQGGVGTGLTVSQFGIRVQEHQDTADNLVSQILRSGGYSEQSFGKTGDVAATATEVHARERRSFITRQKKSRYWGAALGRIMETLLAIDAEYFNSGVKPERPQIIFGDSVHEGPLKVAETAQLLRAAEAASTDTLVRMVNPDWDDERVKDEVDAIRDEVTPEPPPDPLGLFGGPKPKPGEPGFKPGLPGKPGDPGRPPAGLPGSGKAPPAKPPARPPSR